MAAYSPSSTIISPRQTGTIPPVIGGGGWKVVYRSGAVAALLSVICVAIAGVVLVTNPSPTTVSGWYAAFQQNPLVGLLQLDLVMLVSYALTLVLYFALYGALRQVNESLVTFATLLGVVSIVTYFASNVSFTMLVLSQKYAVATSEADRSQLLAAGQSALATWQGSAFDVSYVLGGVGILLFAVVMLRSAVFSNVTAYVTLVLGALMLIPATAGQLGYILSIISLLPLVVWDVLVALRLFRLARAATTASVAP
ncbi:MAG TPA: DUF4386 family protein [Ktedonobacterales bacterium]